VGVYLAEIDGDRAKALKLREERGVEVTKVEEDSPAAKAGLKVGDVILDYSGQRVEGIEQFRRFVRETPAGREVKVGLMREGKAQNVMVRVGSRKMGSMEPMVSMVAPRIDVPEIRMPRGGMVFWSSAALGVEAEGLEGQLAEFFGVKEGVLVRRVMKASAAEKAGLRAGDVITKVDDTRVSTPSELTRAVRSLRTGVNARKSFPLSVVRDKKEITVSVQVEDDDRSEVPWRMFQQEGFPALAPPPAAIPGRVIRL
jgi:serine protease Do